MTKRRSRLNAFTVSDTVMLGANKQYLPYLPSSLRHSADNSVLAPLPCAIDAVKAWDASEGKGSERRITRGYTEPCDNN